MLCSDSYHNLNPHWLHFICYVLFVNCSLKNDLSHEVEDFYQSMSIMSSTSVCAAAVQCFTCEVLNFNRSTLRKSFVCGTYSPGDW